MGPDSISIIIIVVKMFDMVIVLPHKVIATVKSKGLVLSSIVRVTIEEAQLRKVLSYLMVSSLSLHPLILLMKKFYQAYNLTVLIFRKAISISAFLLSLTLDSFLQPRSRHFSVKLANCIFVYIQAGRTRIAQPTISNSWWVQNTRMQTALRHSATYQANSSNAPDP